MRNTKFIKQGLSGGCSEDVFIWEVQRPLNNMGVRGHAPGTGGNLSITFDSPPNLTTNNLLLTRSLTGNTNRQLKSTLYVIWVVYCISSKSKLESGNAVKIITNKRKHICSIFGKPVCEWAHEIKFGCIRQWFSTFLITAHAN